MSSVGTKYIQLIIMLLVSVNGLSQIEKEFNPDNEFIDDLFNDYQGEKPGASVIVIKDGEIAFLRSYGYADLENKIPATPKTNYRIASVTKQFTAVAIMILIYQDKLDYETSLTEIFPEFPQYGTEIKVKHLLTHRSGLVKYNRFIEEDRTEQMLDKDVLNGLLETDSTYFAPGTKFSYSNTGYAVLAQIIEKRSGVSFSEFMAREVFQPLNMTASTILEGDKEISNRAFGYLVNGTEITAKDQSLTSAIQGDGGVYTSVLDYYEWDKALYTDALLPQASLSEAFCGYDENGKSDDSGYGYGWNVRYDKGVKILEHGGSSTGFGSHVIRIPGKRISVAIFTNRNKKGRELSNKAKALISHFSEGEFQMPFEVILEREIDKNGIISGLKLFNDNKKDTANYSVSEGAFFSLAVAYFNDDQNEVAFELFEQLIKDHPAYFGGYYGKALVYYERRKKRQSIKYFKHAIRFSSPTEKWVVDHSEKMINELKD